MNNNSRSEFIKAVVIIMAVVLKFLPLMLQILIGITGLIYIVFHVVELKKEGYSKYRIASNIIAALAVLLAIVSMIIEAKFIELRIYRHYIFGACLILGIIAFMPLPLMDRYAQGGWKSLKPVIWVPFFQTVLLILLFIIYQFSKS